VGPPCEATSFRGFLGLRFLAFGVPDLWPPQSLASPVFGLPSLWAPKSLGSPVFGLPGLCGFWHLGSPAFEVTFEVTGLWPPRFLGSHLWAPGVVGEGRALAKGLMRAPLIPSRPEVGVKEVDQNPPQFALPLADPACFAWDADATGSSRLTRTVRGIGRQAARFADRPARARQSSCASAWGGCYSGCK
jgi:hypothetical protein